MEAQAHMCACTHTHARTHLFNDKLFNASLNTVKSCWLTEWHLVLITLLPTAMHPILPVLFVGSKLILAATTIAPTSPAPSCIHITSTVHTCTMMWLAYSTSTSATLWSFPVNRMQYFCCQYVHYTRNYNHITKLIHALLQHIKYTVHRLRDGEVVLLIRPPLLHVPKQLQQNEWMCCANQVKADVTQKQ
jgi:hypothetical protein